jgi:hypothetical protein
LGTKIKEGKGMRKQAKEIVGIQGVVSENCNLFL